MLGQIDSPAKEHLLDLLNGYKTRAAGGGGWEQFERGQLVRCLLVERVDRRDVSERDYGGLGTTL